MATPEGMAAATGFLVAMCGKEMPVEQVEGYNVLLKHLPDGLLMASCQRAMAEYQYPTIPPVGLILKHAAVLDAPPTALAEAWRAVRLFVARWEYWLTEGLPTHEKTLAKFKADRAALPPLARKAAESYGWSALVTTETGIAFAHFRQLYESLDKPARTEAALPPSVRSPAIASLTGGIGQMPELAAPK